MRHFPGLFAWALLVLFLFGSCSSATEVLERQDLFSLELGKMENQLDLFQFENYKAEGKNRFDMQGGVFTLVNGRAGKILELSSYGDLLSLYYNSRLNPKSVTLGSDTGANRRNRSATIFEFQSPGEIAITRNGGILVEDISPDPQQVFDPELGAILNRVVLRFSPEKKLLDYLGQEGIGGSPFPYIESIHVNNFDDVIVVTRTMKAWFIFWFDANGNRKYLVEIPTDTVPVPEIGKWQPSVQRVIPDPDSPYLLVHIDYHPLASDQDRPIESSIYRINLLSRQWESYIPVPYSAMDEEGSVQSLHEFLGMGPGGTFFLLSRVKGERHDLVVLDRNGRLFQKRAIILPDSKAIESTLNLSAEGILSGFFVYEDRASLVWWRSDSLLSRAGKL